MAPMMRIIEEIEFLMAQVVKEHVSCVAGRMTLDKWTDECCG